MTPPKIVYQPLKNIKLGISQGSILGPLFFLSFINDLPLYLIKLKSKLFADDTTLYHESNYIIIYKIIYNYYKIKNDISLYEYILEGFIRVFL